MSRITLLSPLLLIAVACGGSEDAEPAVIDAVHVSAPATVVREGETLQLTATVEGRRNPVTTVTWQTSDAAVATVNDTGLVTGLAPTDEAVTITASSTYAPDVTGAVQLKVIDRAVEITGVRMEGVIRSLTCSQPTLSLSAVVEGDGAPQEVHWETSNAAVAGVENGVVQGRSLGTVSIIARSQLDTDRYASVTLSVDDLIRAHVDPAASGLGDGSAASPFPRIQDGVDQVCEGGEVWLAPGTYLEGEAVVVERSIILRGPNAGVHPLAEERGPEAIILPLNDTLTNEPQILLAADDVIIDGVLFDGYNPDWAGDRHQLSAIRNSTEHAPARMTVRNVVFQHFTGSVIMLTDFYGGPEGRGGHLIVDNVFQDAKYVAHVNVATGSRAILLMGNFTADIAHNVFRNLYLGIEVNDLSSRSDVVSIRHNYFENGAAFIRLADSSWGAPAIRVTDNNFTSGSWGVVLSHLRSPVLLGDNQFSEMLRAVEFVDAGQVQMRDTLIEDSRFGIAIANNREQGTIRVTAPGAIAGTYSAAGATFGQPFPAEPRSGSVVSADPLRACTDLANPGALAGKIALIERGDCAFIDKVLRAAQAGAIGVIVIQNNSTDPIRMGDSGSEEEVTIPLVMVTQEAGNAMRANEGSVEAEMQPILNYITYFDPLDLDQQDMDVSLENITINTTHTALRTQNSDVASTRLRLSVHDSRFNDNHLGLHVVGENNQASLYRASWGFHAHAAIHNEGSEAIDARDNWWGADDGPSGGVFDVQAGEYANGSGERIEGAARFYPYLTQPLP